MPLHKVNKHAFRISRHPFPVPKVIAKPRTVQRSAKKARQAAAIVGRVVDPSADPRTVGGRLTLCRRAKGLSKKEVADAVKIKPQSLGQLENGASKQPAADTLLDMRDRLGFDPDYIIRGKGMPLLPNFEEQAAEHALISIYRELKPENRRSVLAMAQAVRRAQSGSSSNDPYPFDPPGGPDDN